MNANVLIPLIAGFVGAFIGALSSIATIWIQQKAQSKRDKLKLSCELARVEHEFNFELAKEKGIAARLPPLSSYQHFHFEVLEAGKLDGPELVKIKTRNRALIEELRNYYEQNP